MGPSLLLKINVLERMVFKHIGYASEVTWKYIKLVYNRGAKLEEPYFGFDLFRFRRWGEARWSTVDGQCWRHSKVVGSRCRIATDGRPIHRKDVCRAVVETAAILKIHFHCDKAVVTIESDLTQTAVLETCLRPGSKDLT